MTKRDRERALRALDRLDRDRELAWDLIAPRNEYGERQYPTDLTSTCATATDDIRRGTHTLRDYLVKGSL